uniref:Uncharacterized protein n=1 Tax=uncultured prokaryote TaxID=198431 RepID=A0A0H5Q5B9_9ZZZZ|nr:hypothetical protein [uncultured prokaryote]
MPHPIYGPPDHSLDRLSARLTIPSRRNGYIASVTVNGESETKRGNLWTAQESWTQAEQDRGLQVADWLQHLVLVSIQDRPITPTGLQHVLGAKGWEDQPLPF